MNKSGTGPGKAYVEGDEEWAANPPDAKTRIIEKDHQAQQLRLDLQAFYDALERFDWHYPMSDDHRSYRAGQRREKELREWAEKSEAHKRLHAAFHEYHYWDPDSGTERMPKPRRPA